jgi:hypothetical protein
MTFMTSPLLLLLIEIIILVFVCYAEVFVVQLATERPDIEVRIVDRLDETVRVHVRGDSLNVVHELRLDLFASEVEALHIHGLLVTFALCEPLLVSRSDLAHAAINKLVSAELTFWLVNESEISHVDLLGR